MLDQCCIQGGCTHRDQVVSVQEKDTNRVRGMQIMLERQTHAAAAAASASSEAAAQAAVEAQLAPPAMSGALGPEPMEEDAAGSGSALAGGCCWPALLEVWNAPGNQEKTSQRQSHCSQGCS